MDRQLRPRRGGDVSTLLVAFLATPSPSPSVSTVLQSPAVTAVRSVAATVATSPSAGTGGSTAPTTIQWWTLGAALATVVVALLSAILVRVTGSGTVKAAKDAAKAAKDSAAAARVSSGAADRAATATQESAAAATKSAAAATTSAKAAEDAVLVNARAASAAERSADAALESATTSAVRAKEDSRFKRYQEAAEQLGSPNPTVRLAGVYAMTQLADDSDEQRQTCVHLLCAYLSMPWPVPGTDEGEARVRASIIQVIEEHVRAERQPDKSMKDGLWSDLDFKFDGAVLRDFRLTSPVFRGHVSFVGATFEGECVVYGAVFDWGIILARAVIKGDVTFSRMTLGANFFAMELSVLPGARLDVAQSWREPGANVVFHAALIEGYVHVFVHPDGTDRFVDVSKVEVRSGGYLEVDCGGASQAAGDWLDASDLFVHPQATVRLPHGALTPGLQKAVSGNVEIVASSPPPS
jgi:hypothetical protein